MLRSQLTRCHSGDGTGFQDEVPTRNPRTCLALCRRTVCPDARSSAPHPGPVSFLSLPSGWAHQGATLTSESLRAEPRARASSPGLKVPEGAQKWPHSQTL